MNTFAIVGVLLGLIHPLSGIAKKPVAATCKVTFSLVERDALGNINNGLSSDGKTWFEKKVHSKYPNVCYGEQASNEGVWFYIDISAVQSSTGTAVSHGDMTSIDVSPTSTPVFTLKIGQFRDGNLTVLRTFQREGVLPTQQGSVTGFLKGFRNPERDVIEDAVAWLSAQQLPLP